MQAQDSRTPWMDAAEELRHIVRARRGDRKAFVALLRHYLYPIYRLSFALTRDVRVAVAVTHETVLKANEGVRFIAEGQRFFPWVARIVRNLARSRHRTDVRMVVGASNETVEPEVVAFAKAHLDALDGLEPDEQVAIALRVCERLPYEHVEDVLRTPPGSALSLLAIARDRMTSRVSEEERAA